MTDGPKTLIGLSLVAAAIVWDLRTEAFTARCEALWTSAGNTLAAKRMREIQSGTDLSTLRAFELTYGVTFDDCAL